MDPLYRELGEPTQSDVNNHAVELNEHGYCILFSGPNNYIALYKSETADLYQFLHAHRALFLSEGAASEE